MPTQAELDARNAAAAAGRARAQGQAAPLNLGEDTRPLAVEPVQADEPTTAQVDQLAQAEDAAAQTVTDKRLAAAARTATTNPAFLRQHILTEMGAADVIQDHRPASENADQVSVTWFDNTGQPWTASFIGAASYADAETLAEALRKVGVGAAIRGPKETLEDLADSAMDSPVALALACGALSVVRDGHAALAWTQEGESFAAFFISKDHAETFHQALGQREDVEDIRDARLESPRDGLDLAELLKAAAAVPKPSKGLRAWWKFRAVAVVASNSALKGVALGAGVGVGLYLATEAAARLFPACC